MEGQPSNKKERKTWVSSVSLPPIPDTTIVRTTATSNMSNGVFRPDCSSNPYLDAGEQYNL